MKEKYEEAKIEIVELKFADVVTASGGGSTGGGLAGGDWTIEGEDSFAGGGIK